MAALADVLTHPEQIGFEIWTMQDGIMFDNIYIGHSVEDAEKLAEEAWRPKRDAEKALLEADKPKPKPSTGDLKFTEDPVTYIKEKVELFATIAKKDPLQAVQFVPEVAGGIVAVLVGLVGIILAVAGGSSTPAAKKKDDGKEAKAKASKGSATGAEVGKGEATKRNTRSQQS